MDLVLVLPRLLKMLRRLWRDPDLPVGEKALLAATAAYLASPIDLIPDSIPVLGQLDDLLLIVLVLRLLARRLGPEKLRAAWDGPGDVVELLETVEEKTSRLLPSPVRRQLARWVKARGEEPGDESARPSAREGSPAP